MGIYPGDSPNPQLPIFDFENKNQQQLKDQKQKKQKKNRRVKRKEEERRGQITCIYLSDLSVQTRLQINIIILISS